MKAMKKILLMSFVALVAVAMTSCMHVKLGDKDWSFGDIHRNDTPTQVNQVGQVTAMEAFDALNVCGPFNIILEQGDTSSVRVEGTTEQLEKITIYVKEGELYIDERESKWKGDEFKGMQIFVSTRAIKGIDIAGSGNVTAPKALAAANLSLEVAGSGDITLAQLTCEELKIQIAGSGDVTSGPVQANKVKTEIAGSGNIDIAALTCKMLDNEIAGSGDIVCNNLKVDQVKSDIAGSGDIYLKGQIGTHKEDIAGSGKVHVNESE